MKESENTPANHLVFIYDQLVEIRAERLAMMTIFAALVQTHPDRQALRIAFEHHIEGVIACALPKEYPDESLVAVERIANLIRKAFDDPDPRVR